MRVSKFLCTFLAISFFNITANCTLALLPNSGAPTTAISANPKSSKQQTMQAKMKVFASLTLENYEKIKGRKLNFFERLSFRISQRRVKTLLKHNDYGDEPGILQKISWLFKGILLGPIALLIGYIFLKDEERELIKWIWFGCIGFVAILAIILLA